MAVLTSDNNITLFLQTQEESASSLNLRLQGLENFNDSLDLFLKTAENNVLGEDIVAFYRFEEVSRSFYRLDSSWNELALQDTLERIVTTTGKIGSGGLFNSRYPNIAHRPNASGLGGLRTQGSFTVAGWANFGSLGDRTIAALWDTTNVKDQEWALMHQAGASGVIFRLNNGEVDFNQHNIDSYDVTEDIDMNSEVLDDGNSIKVSGNSWRQIPFKYNLTSNSMISFDFISRGEEPEIQGVGLDEDLTLTSGRVIQIYGTESFGVQTYINQYNLFTNGSFTNWTGDDPDGWTVVESLPNEEVSEVGDGEGNGGTGLRMCNLFTNSSNNVEISQSIVTEDGETYQIDLDINNFTSGTLRIINDDGDPLFTQDYTTAGIKQIFFEADSTLTSITLKRQVANTDVTINSVFCRKVVGDSGVTPHIQHYEIPIGSEYTGQMNHLFFVNDDDTGVGGSSTYSNITVFESGQPTEISIASTGAIVNNQFYHVAGVYDKENNESKLYIDGVVQGVQKFNGVIQNGSGDFSVGGMVNGASNPFEGILDAIGIWSRPFTDRDITLLYNQGNGTEFTPVPNFAPLFLKSPEPENNNLNLFVEGAISTNDNLTLFLKVLEEFNSNIDLVVIGHIATNNSLDLFLKVPEPLNIGIPLFLQSFIDTEDNTLQLFLNNLSEDETLNLYISGSNVSETEPKPPSEATEDSGFIPINDAITLFIKGNPELEENLKLFVKAVEGIPNSNINLFVDGGNAINSSLDLTLVNVLDTLDDDLDLYIHGASN